MTPRAEPEDTRPGAPESGALATATALVGLIAYAATWRLWHSAPPVALEPGVLWTTVLLLGLPIVGVYTLTGAEITHFGFQRGDTERAPKYVFGAVVLSLPFLVAALFVSGDPVAWPQAPGAGSLASGGGTVVALAWRAFVLEWFFRGFVLFGLLYRFGARAILLQTVAFGLLYLGAPWPIALAAWPAAFVLGFIAWRCSSFLPTATVHILIVLLMRLAMGIAGWKPLTP